MKSHPPLLPTVPALAALLTLISGGCEATLGDGHDAGSARNDAGLPDAGPFDSGTFDASAPDAGAPDAGPLGDGGLPPTDGGVPPLPPVDVSAACSGALCWMAGTLSSACGERSRAEDFSSGRYGLHSYALALTGGVRARVTVQRTGGDWSPALLVLDGAATVHDGERSIAAGPLLVEDVVVGRASDTASFTIVADTDRGLTVLLTSWSNRDSAFVTRLPTDAAYRVTVDYDCPEDPTTLYSPPNFDPTDVVGGYVLLPPADPAGLYARKADGCSRGNRLLVDVIYTAALRWSRTRPELPRLSVRDMNEGACSTVDHATHDRGIDVDLTAGCGTAVSCSDNSAAVDLAEILVDTGAVCGILFNDTAVQAEVNAYFASRFSYRPWRDQFMRTVTGHVSHFHVRVMSPDGTCN